MAVSQYSPYCEVSTSSPPSPFFYSLFQFSAFLKVEQIFWLDKYVDSKGQEIITSLLRFPHTSIWTLPPRTPGGYKNPLIWVSSIKTTVILTPANGEQSLGLSQSKCRYTSNNRKVSIKHFQKWFKHDDQVGFISGIQGWLNIQIPINVIHHINKTKRKKNI